MALRSQAQVDTEHCTFICWTRKYLSDRLCQANEIFAVRDVGIRGCFAIAEDVEQVHVGAVVQFVTSELSHREDGERHGHESGFQVRMLRNPISLLMNC